MTVERTEGAQSITRAAALLRAVGAEASGVLTAEAARRVGISRPTAHRMLTALHASGLLDRDSGSGRWLLGPEVYLLGAVAARRFDVTEHARPEVRRLADLTGESAFYSVRRGEEAVCVLREEGSFPLRSFVLQEGTRFPLGVASAGLVIAAFLPEDEVEAYLARTDLVPEWGPVHAAAGIRKRLAETRRAGYSTNPALIVEGSWGMGAAVFDPEGHPVGAVSITGVESRFPAKRRKELGTQLLACAHRISGRLADLRR